MRKTVVIGAALLLVQASLLAFTLLQERTWGGANNDDAIEVAFASDGSVFVAGTTETADGDRDAFLLKYGPDRSLQWERTYGTPSNLETGFDDEFAAGLAVAADDSVYVTGQFGTGVLFLAKFSAEGELLWDSTWGENGTIGTGAAIDSEGNVYVSGLSFVINGGANDTEALVLKFEPDGNLAWARAWGGDGFDAARAIAVGTDGVYVAGETNSFFANDAFVVKFEFDGDVAWERDWGVDGVQAPFTGLTGAFGAGADSDGNVYITGNTFDSGLRKNIILVKFSAAGELVWEMAGGPGFGVGLDVAVSADDTTVFVSGNILSDDPDFFGGHAFVAEFTSGGKAKKANTWGGSLDDSASAESVVVDASGLVVTAGSAGPGPYVFGRASNSAKTPDAHLVIPDTSHLFILSTTLGTDEGQLLVPDEAVGGNTDAFTLWLQR